MNRKKINIFLIPGVLFIWAFILVKIFSYSKEPENQSYFPVVRSSKKDSILLADTITLYANYRDPFSRSKIKMSVQTKSEENTLKTIQPVNTIVAWPKITYFGLIKSLKRGEDHVLLMISDRTLIAERDKEIDGIKIISVYPDSIKIQFRKETKFFKRISI
jgi:hypothetical protein